MHMNEIVHKFLSSRDQLMPEIHLRQPVFTYSACGLFMKNKKKERMLLMGFSRTIQV